MQEYDEFCAKQFMGEFRDFVRLYFGERCLHYEPNCACCKAWRIFDQMDEQVGEL